MATAVCATCGKEFHREKFRPSKTGLRGCSASCRAKIGSRIAQTLNLKGFEEQFWKRVPDRNPSGSPDDCWEWTGSKAGSGYGRFYAGGSSHYAHRASYAIHHGPVPEGFWVLHSCDNPPCVNPSHLRLGTPAENSADMVERKRQRIGDNAPWSVLNEKKVSCIKELLSEGRMKKDIARAFGVHVGTIQSIALGDNWKQVR